MAGYTVENVGINIVATADEGIKALEKLLLKITDNEKAMSKFSDELGKAGKGVQDLNKEVKELNKGNEFKNLNKDVENINDTLTSLDKTMEKTFNIAKFAVVGKVMKDIAKTTTRQSLEAISSNNLFTASLGSMSDEARVFQDTITSAFGISKQETMETQGYFNAMISSLRIGNEEAALMSENLTKLTYDLSSLFGTDADKMFTRLQSGMIGQTKPLRNVGIDVTAQTLQTYLNDMGLDVFVNDLTQAEKVMLRYIAILDQSQISHANFAATIESPVNQVRILKQQVAELGQWVGHTFITMFGGALPYINAVVMALKEMIKALALFFGFNMSSFSRDMGTAVGGIDNVEKNLGGVGGAARKAGRAIKDMLGLLGFDEIHNLETPKESPDAGGGAGGGGGLGTPSIYDDLLAALGEYDNKMDSVQMKAEKLRNWLLDALGFTYDINSVTGELENLNWGGLWEMATPLQVIAGILGILAGYKLIGFITEMLPLIDLAVGGLGFLAGKALDVAFGLLEVVFTSQGGIPIVSNLWAGFQFLADKFVAVLGPAGAVIGLFVLMWGAIVELHNTNEEWAKRFDETWNNMKDTLLQVWEYVIEPVVGAIASIFVSLWEEALKPLWDDWVEMFRKISEVVMDFYNDNKDIIDGVIQTFGALATFLVSVFSGAFTGVFSLVGNILGGFLSIAGSVFGGAANVISGFVKIIRGLLTGDTNLIVEGAKKIFEGLGTFVKGVFFAIPNAVIRTFNVLISALNAFFRGLNRIKIPDWVPGIGGAGFNLNMIDKIPLFKDGGFPEDGLFFANSSELVGKFSNGRTAVANNDQIIDGVSAGVAMAVYEVMSGIDFGGKDNKPIYLFPSQQAFGSFAMDAIDKTTMVTGKRMKTV